MTNAEKREAARQFVNKWRGRGKEDEDDRSFWIDFLMNVMGLSNVTDRIEFQKKVVGADGNIKRIDAYIPETKVLIEQKSLGVDLSKPQAGHNGMTPYEQAKMYDNGLPVSEKARWIVTSNFAEIRIYDMDTKRPEETTVIIQIDELIDKLALMDFLIKKEVKELNEELELSIKAGELVGKIYDSFQEQYNDPMAIKSQHSLNILCVRLVFCLYAEDAELFGAPDAFMKYINQYEPKDIRRALLELFNVLNTPEDARGEMYLDVELAAFPYCNGGLFANENIEIPKITQDIKDTLLDAARFNWSKISPTIFGAVFESTLNPETRRAGGMHYTSIENIHKVIDPLFLDNLKAELNEILEIKVDRTRERKLRDFQDKLASLKFFDPAAGSGNFLTETYVSIRRIENIVISELNMGQIAFGFESGSPIKVDISQFYGIEINDYAVEVAKAALWIAESQMMKETEEVVHMQIDFLPLKTNATIVEGNALQLDWEHVIKPTELTYIMGNPPFIGKKEQTSKQKQDLRELFSGYKVKVGSLDYVSGWFFKAAKLAQNNEKLRIAFVSTDSICQGEHVPNLWSILCNEFGMDIDFAHRTFKWSSEARLKAEVYCVIVGFSQETQNIKKNNKLIFEGDTCRTANHVNAYLANAPDIWLESRKSHISGCNTICYGSMPIDNGFLILSEEEFEQIQKRESSILPYIRRYAGADELLKGTKRYCIWLENVNRKVILDSPFLKKRVCMCKQFRESSKRAATQKLAATPQLFGEIRQPDGDMIVIPKVSSKHRKYIPMLLVNSEDYIINGSSLIIPDGSLFEFGLLSSNVHNAWIRSIAETWGHSFQYSTDIYNNFPVPEVSLEIRQRIEDSAKRILDIRALHPEMTIADMYNPKIGLIRDLRDAHIENDRNVMTAYELNVSQTSEADCVAHLMKMYQEVAKGVTHF